MEIDLENIIIAFVTGLTTGGLSCLAVQGGLLASSLANQIEKDFQNPVIKKRRIKTNRQQSRTKLALPILAFLIAKVVAYTILGFLLGLVGQMFQLSLMTRAILQIGIGVFMLGTALRMLNVHPIFRYFAFEPPAFLRRRLRKTAAEAPESSLASPIFLGFLTVLIPCGVTQAMMAVALGTADPIQGAVLMFAFTLGTSPVFFAVAYFATRLGAKLEKHFMRFVAVVILVLAVITIDSGVTLTGSPISLSRWVSRTFSSSSDEVSSKAELQADDSAANSAGGGSGASKTDQGVITVNVKNYGYSPDVVHAKAGIPIKLQLVSKNVRSCSRAFIIPSLGVQKILKATGTDMIDIPAQEKGTQIPFSCSMGMYSGTIIFDL